MPESKENLFLFYEILKENRLLIQIWTGYGRIEYVKIEPGRNLLSAIRYYLLNTLSSSMA